MCRGNTQKDFLCGEKKIQTRLNDEETLEKNYTEKKNGTCQKSSVANKPRNKQRVE